jgi:hypothetical protein
MSTSHCGEAWTCASMSPARMPVPRTARRQRWRANHEQLIAISTLAPGWQEACRAAPSSHAWHWQCVDLGGRAGAVDRTRMQQVYYQPANCLCQARGRSAGEASPRAPLAGWITDRSPRYARVYKYSVLHYAVRRGGDARGRSTDRFTHAGWDLGNGGDGWLPGMGGGTGGGGGRAAART